MAITAPYKSGPVTINELLGSGDSERVKAMLSLYGELFPDYRHYIPRMNSRSTFPSATRPGQIAHYWLFEIDNKPVGLSTFRYIHTRSCGLGISFALRPEVRSLTISGQRLSVFLISKIMEQLLLDSKRMGARKFWGLVTEVEHLDLMNHYKRIGMLELPIKYYEPIFPAPVEGRSRDEELKLVEFMPVFLGITVNPETRQTTFDRPTLINFALAFLVDHYGLPEEHIKVQSIIQSIPEG